jgi:hypothetical protein
MLLALLLGQWLAVAHGFLHPASATPDVQCELCLHAQGMDSGAVSALPQHAVPVASQEAPQQLAAAPVQSSLNRNRPIRGPPISLA